MSADGTPTARRRLLVVEDEEPMRRLVVRAFVESYEVFEAGDGAAALEIARRVRPDVIITDERMPKMNGVEFLTQVKDELPHTIRVLVSGFTDYGSLVDAVNAAHVHHYFEKPFHTVDVRTVVETLQHATDLAAQRDTLLVRLDESVRELEETNSRLREKEQLLSHTVDERTNALERTNDELRRTNQRLRDLAVRDGLTGLFNHRYLMEHLELELARSQRYARQFSVLFFDLDNFKAINDRYGHAMGDQVLLQIADVLRGTGDGLRRSDFGARYGGEEFCVILPETPLDGGRIKAERLRRSVEAEPWSRVSAGLSVTVSVGVAAFPDNGVTITDLLRAADKALYVAKRSGKNRVTKASAPGVSATS